MRAKVLGLVVVGFIALFGVRASAQQPAPAGEEEHEGSGSASGSAEPTPASGAEPEHHEGTAAEPAGSAEPGSAAEPAGSAEPGSAAEPEHHEGSAAEPAGSAEPEHHEGSAAEPEHHEGSAAEPEQTTATAPDQGEGIEEPEGGSYKEEEIAPGVENEVGVDGDGDPYMEYDEDGDGKMSPEELNDAKEFVGGFKEAGIPANIDDADLDKRPPGKMMLPSLTPEMFRKLVHLAKRKVLAKMEAKMAEKTDKKMTQFTWIVVGCSLAGFLLLFAPLFLRKKYPGQDATLVKYSALAGFTFFVTVLLFGGVLYGMKTAQGQVGGTAPNIAIAGGFFDTLDDHAEDYIVMGKELFAPTLEQLTSKSDEQPAVALIANGQKIVKDAMVFVKIAKLFKKLDFIFSILPVILLLVTIVLFMLSIKPTLIEIIKLPAAAASGTAGAGRAVVEKAIKRVQGELLASLCALGVLFVLALVSGFILGRVCKPALNAIINYFAYGVDYLQFVHDASSTMVFVALFSVIFFLVLNLLTLILSMSFFLGKTQKIFQARFNDGVPLSKHAQFWKWGTASVLLVQIIPLVFVFVAEWGLEHIIHSSTSGVSDPTQVGWTKLMIAGPLFLVIGYLVFFWAARGLKGIVFLQRYKVTPKAPKQAPAQVAA